MRVRLELVVFGIRGYKYPRPRRLFHGQAHQIEGRATTGRLDDNITVRFGQAQLLEHFHLAEPGVQQTLSASLSA